MASKAAVKKETTEMAPSWMKEESNRGSEQVTMNDMTVPRVDVIQSLSPQRKKSDPAFIEGAEEGIIFNPVTGELYGSKVTIVPVYFKKEWTIWVDRDKGGGFRGAFDSQKEAVEAKSKLEDGDICEIVDTHQQFVLVMNNGRIEEAVISMAKSKMRASRQLNTLIQLAPGDRWAKAYELSSVEVDGPKGTYYNFNVKAMAFVTEEVYKRGENLYNSITSGAASIDYSDEKGDDDDEIDY